MFKRWMLWLHKWLGLLSGIVIFIVSLTGCVYVFHDDLKTVFYPQKYYIQEGGESDSKKPLPLSVLLQKANNALGGEKDVVRVDLYPALNRTWVFRAVQTDESKILFWNYYTYYDRVFINPFTGEVQAIENSKTEFFQLILQTHMNLLLGKKVGKPLVAWSTVIFIVLIISGLPLWWPKKWTRKKLKRSLLLRFGVKRKRLNYDLHNVLGFHSSLLALLLCVTGLVFSFPNFKTAYIAFFNYITTKERAVNEVGPTHSIGVPQFHMDRLDNALFFSLNQHSDADMMSIRLRGNASATDDIQIRLSKDKTSDFVWYYFSKSDGQINKVVKGDELNPGDKLASMNYDLHVGSIGGMWTKIIAFIVSLACASLPITGFIIWINKNKK